MKYDLLFKHLLNNKSPINLIFGDDSEEDTKPDESKKKYDLVFSKPLNNKNPINLVFGGDDDSIDPEPRTHIVSAAVDLYEFSLLNKVSVDYGIDYNLMGINSSVIVIDAETSRNEYSLILHESFKLYNEFFDNFSDSILMKYQYSIAWGPTDKLKSNAINRWGHANLINAIDVNVGIKNSYLKASNSQSKWGSAGYIFYNRDPFFWYAVSSREDRSINFSSAEHSGRDYDVLWNIADAFTNKRNIIWNVAGLPSGCGPSIRPPVTPIPPPDVGPIVIVRDLVFCKKTNNKNPIDLIFGDTCHEPDDDYSISDEDVYIVQNNVEIFRVDDGRIIKAFNVEIGANRKDYLWSGSLSLPFSELEKIVDTPEIEVNINQYKFVVDIDDIKVQQEFNRKSIEISVSSTASRLKTIKAHNIDNDLSSIAIMSAQLIRDDLETGFKFVSKNSVDWIIPSGIIEYDDAFALDIINSIALSVGDTVISHAYKKEIIVKEKYSSDQPIYKLPIGKLFDYSTNEENSTEYNAIVVTGENKGITAVVKKEGTAGEKIAPMIVNRLITDQSAARRAAINSIFNSNDRSITIDVESILFKESPMIYPSDVVQIGNDFGWVDDVKIRCEMADKALIVRHSMSIEKKAA